MVIMDDFEQKILEVDNEKLVCEYKLAKENAVILHGAGRSQRKRYYAIANELLRQGLGVVMFDFSGHGESTGKLEELSLTRRKRQSSAVINALVPPDSPLYLVGFSMGAQTACDLLSLYSKRVKGVFLACPAIYRADVEDLPFGNSKFTSRLREPNSWKTTNAVQHLANFDGKTVVAIGSDDTVIPKDVISMLKTSTKHLYFEEFKGVTHALAPFLTEHPRELAKLVKELTSFRWAINSVSSKNA